MIGVGAVSLVFKALGGGSEVGASSYLYEFGSDRILVDAGVRPNVVGPESLPDFTHLAEAPAALLLTHAHSDHIGAVPLLSRMFPGMRVYGTKATLRLALDMLLDSVKVQERQGAPLFTAGDVQASLERSIVVSAGKRFKVNSVDVLPLPAGHLVGAVSYRLASPAGSVMHLGDVNNTGSLLTESAFLPADGAALAVDVVVSEATYGDVITHTSRRMEVRRFVSEVAQTLSAGGRVLVPAFALGRSSEVALVLDQHMRSGVIPRVPIVLDGLVRTVHQTLGTDLFSELPAALRSELSNSGRNPLMSDQFVLVRNGRERAGLLNSREPMVIIASSGMLTAGVSPVYARELLGGERNLLALVGYQDESAPGRRLLEAAEGAGEVMLPAADGRSLESVPIAAKVMSASFSGHADAAGLVGIVKRYSPSEVVLVHGDGGARAALGGLLRGSVWVHTPKNGDELRLLERPDVVQGGVGSGERSRTRLMRFSSEAAASVRGSSLVLEFPDDVDLEHLLGGAEQFMVSFVKAGKLRIGLKERSD